MRAGTEINRMPEGRMIHRRNGRRVDVRMERQRDRTVRVRSRGTSLDA